MREDEIALVASEVGGEGDAVGHGKLEERVHALIFRKGEEISGDAGGGGPVGLLLFGGFGFGWLRAVGLGGGVGRFSFEPLVEFVDLDLVGGG